MATYDDTDTPAGLVPFRVSELWRWKQRQDDWRREVDADRQTLQFMRNDIKTIKRVAITLLVSFVTGSASITVAILLSTR